MTPNPVPSPWLERARELFDYPRPATFGNPHHCGECADHETLLQAHNPDDIGLEQLGNPSMDPLCYSHAEGLRYYFPAMVRLALDPSDQRYYLDQFLFHLSYAGADNRMLRLFNEEQRAFVVAFLSDLKIDRAEQIERMGDSGELLDTIQLWQRGGTQD